MQLQKLHNQFSKWLQSHGGVFASLIAGLVFFLPYERILVLELPILAGGYTLRLSHIFAALLIAGYSIAIITKRRKISSRVWDYFLAGFLFSYLLSALLAQDLSRALTVWVFTVFVIAAAFVISLLISSGWEKYLEPALVATTWIVLVFGFYQYFGDSIGLPLEITGLRELYTKSVLGFPRIQSFGLEPLYYASFLQIPLYYFVVKLIFGKKTRLWLIFAIITQLILTSSRGAILAVGFVLIVLLAMSTFLYRRQIAWNKIVKLVGIIICSILASYTLMFSSGLLSRVFSKQTGQSGGTIVGEAEVRAKSTFQHAANLDEQDDRTRNRSLAIDAWKSKPVLGVGPGNFHSFAVEAFPQYSGSSGYVIVNNEILELLSESGLVGIILFVGFVLLIFYYAVYYLIIDHKSKRSVNVVMIAGLCYLAGLAVQYQTFSTLYIMHVWVAIGILMGCIRIAENQVKTPPASKKPKIKRNAKKA